MNNKLDGVIASYNSEKRFGFIRNAHQKDIFFHIREYRPNKTPEVGEKVIFDLSNDSQGRICATNIQELSFVVAKQHQKQQRIERRQAYEAYQERQEQKHGVLNLVCLLSIVYLLILAILAFFIGVLRFVLVWYLIAGLASFAMYYADKVAAQNGERRTLEKTLHFIDVFGGWIGASFAHKLLNHKATKAEFRAVFYVTILVNVVCLFGVMVFLSFG